MTDLIAQQVQSATVLENIIATTPSFNPYGSDTMHIAVLEDEKNIAAHTEELLKSDGHSVVVFNSGKTLLKSLAQETFDLFILDWNVPDLSGIKVLHELRQNKRLTTPVLFLTSRQFEQDIVQALESGADDYCVKPVREKELLARIKVLQRRTYQLPAHNSKNEYQGYTFNIHDNTVTWEKTLQMQSVRLSDKEFKLAQYLFEQPNRAMSRKRLMQEIWGREDEALSRTLDVHICRVRLRLDLSSTSGRLQLKAIHGFGYKLVNLSEEEPHLRHDERH
jgi:DNA-binding response OmpR family regulator